jgi:hypothetical protein
MHMPQSRTGALAGHHHLVHDGSRRIAGAAGRRQKAAA